MKHSRHAPSFGYDPTTPDTPTDSDAAARARTLVDAADTDEWWWHLDINDPAASALIAAAPTLITNLLAERDHWREEARQHAENSGNWQDERDAAVASADERVAADLALLHEARNEQYEAERRERTAINIAKQYEAERDAAVARAVQLGTDIDSVRSCWHANEGPRWTANVIEALRHSGLMDTAAERGTDR